MGYNVSETGNHDNPEQSENTIKFVNGASNERSNQANGTKSGNHSNPEQNGNTIKFGNDTANEMSNKVNDIRTSNSNSDQNNDTINSSNETANEMSNQDKGDINTGVNMPKDVSSNNTISKFTEIREVSDQNNNLTNVSDDNDDSKSDSPAEEIPNQKSSSSTKSENTFISGINSSITNPGKSSDFTDSSDNNPNKTDENGDPNTREALAPKNDSISDTESRPAISAKEPPIENPVKDSNLDNSTNEGNKETLDKSIHSISKENISQRNNSNTTTNNDTIILSNASANTNPIQDNYLTNNSNSDHDETLNKNDVSANKENHDSKTISSNGSDNSSAIPGYKLPAVIPVQGSSLANDSNDNPDETPNKNGDLNITVLVSKTNLTSDGDSNFTVAVNDYSNLIPIQGDNIQNISNSIILHKNLRDTPDQKSSTSLEAPKEILTTTPATETNTSILMTTIDSSNTDNQTNSPIKTSLHSDVNITTGGKADENENHNNTREMYEQENSSTTQTPFREITTSVSDDSSFSGIKNTGGSNYEDFTTASPTEASTVTESTPSMESSTNHLPTANTIAGADSSIPTSIESNSCSQLDAKCWGRHHEWNCCTETCPCGEGGGDCDSDAQCVDGLRCGTNNCLFFHPQVAHNRTDCCFRPNPVHEFKVIGSI